jgi:hypothetical protein
LQVKLSRNLVPVIGHIFPKKVFPRAGMGVFGYQWARRGAGWQRGQV